MKAPYFLVFLFFFSTGLKNINSSHIKGIEFTSKYSDGIKLLFDSDVNYSKGFTICLRVMFALLNPNTVFDSHDIVMVSIDNYLSGNMVVRILGINYHFQRPSQILDLQPYVWYAFCTSYDAKQKLVRFAIDDNMIYKESVEDTAQVLVGNSTQLSGTPEWPFVGKITDFNVWNKYLSDEDITSFVFCHNSFTYNNDSTMAFRWSKVNLTQIGKYMVIQDIPLEDICSHPAQAKIEWFKIPIKFAAASYVSEHMGGEMSLPLQQSDLADLYSLTDLSPICRLSFWVPIVRSTENSSIWLNGNVSVNFLPWLTGQPNGYPIQNCVGVHKSGIAYYDVECTEKRCFNVKVSKTPVFHLRGQCLLIDNFDLNYVYHYDAAKAFPHNFQGFSGQIIITGNALMNSWDLKVYNKTSDDFNRIAYLANMEKFPFGTQYWTFFENGLWIKSLFKMTHVCAL